MGATKKLLTTGKQTMQTTDASKVPRIVIVGGGAGGLELATRLGRTVGRAGKAKVVLVDCSPTHIWKPLLHEVATGALNTGEDEVNYFSHAHNNGYEFEFGYMEGLDRERRCIKIAPVYGMDNRMLSPAREIAYDKLVLAVGARTNDFGTPGVAEYTKQLNTRGDAEHLRRHLLEQAFSIAMGADQSRVLNIVIVGGGATGVELAAELHYTMNELRQHGSHLAPDRVNISVIEGADRILLAAPPALSSYAEDELLKRRIRVMTRSKVAEVTQHGVRFTDGTVLPSDITVWAAGVKAPEWLGTLDGLAVNKINQLKVTAGLQCEGEPHVYAIGDCASVPDGDSGRFLPATAQAAHQQAKWLAHTLRLQLKGREPGAFVFKPQGVMVSLGKHTAVGSLAAVVGPKRNYQVEGRGAKLIYASLYRMHQSVVHGWLRAAMLYCGDKLRQVARPALKLH
jgi:NADH dehydrogenase